MSIKIHHTDSDTLVIAFTGLAGKLNVNPDKFFISAGLKNVSKIIITDKSKRLTLGGVCDQFDTFDKVLNKLKHEIKTTSPKEVIVTGTSGGAHSAILYGYLLRADKVISFAPYTYLSIRECARLNDPVLHSMKRLLASLDQLPNNIKTYFDLKNVLSVSNNITKYYIHVSKYHAADSKRANNLKDIPEVTIISHPFDRHSIASFLVSTNTLAVCFEQPGKAPAKRPYHLWRHTFLFLKTKIKRCVEKFNN